MTVRLLGARCALAASLVLVAAAADAGVDRWSEAGPGAPATLVAMSASDPYRLFAAVGCEVFASSDAGETWQRRSTVPGCAEELSLLVAPAPGALYADTGVGASLLLRSGDGGRSWHPLVSAYVVSLLVHPDDPSLILAGGSGILRSADGGESWEQVLPGAGQGGTFPISYHASSLYIDPVDPSLIHANVQVISPGFLDEACYVSHDDGESWTEPPGSCFEQPVEWLPGLQRRPEQCDVYWPFSIACDTSDFEPTAEVPSIPGDTLVIVPSQPPVLYAADEETSGVRRSLDGGGSWQPVAGWDMLLPQGPSSPRQPPGVLVHPAAPSRVYRLAGPIYRATFVGAEPLLAQEGRIETRAAWRPPGERAAAARPAAIGGETGAFWFRRPDNLELGLKVLDGRAVNQRFWVFQTALTNLEYEVTATDVVTGESRSWLNPHGRFAARADTAHFVDSPAGGAAGPAPTATPAGEATRAFGSDPEPAAVAAPGASACTPSPSTLCLLGRLEVALDWRDGGELRPAFAAPVNDEVGAFRFHGAGSLQLLVKALDARPVDGRFWVFYGGLTDRELRLTVTDSETGSTRTFESGPGELSSGADTETFLAP